MKEVLIYMASVNWLKITSQKAAAMAVHFGRSRGKVNHSNAEIDPARTQFNSSIGAASWDEAYQKMKARTAAVDEVLPPKRIRADRKTACLLEYTCPASVRDAGRDEEFFEHAHSLFKNFFGPENVHGTFVHRDEVHQYTDSKTGAKRESLYHAHCLVSCYVEGKGINGKAFETRARLTELNAAMCDMVRSAFGIEYNTGDSPRGMTAEALKAESRVKEARDALAAHQAALQAHREASRPEVPLKPIRRKEAHKGLFRASDAEVTYSLQDAVRLESALRYAEGSQHMERAVERMDAFIDELAAGPQVMAAQSKLVQQARDEADRYKRFVDVLAEKADRYDELHRYYPDEVAKLEHLMQEQKRLDRQVAFKEPSL